VTPGEARRRGEGLTLRWGLAPTPFGTGLFALAPRGLAGLGFVDEAGLDAAFADMHRRFPAADWIRDDQTARDMAVKAFGDGGGPLPVVLIGSPFHIQVWKALLTIPAGATPPTARSPPGPASLAPSRRPAAPSGPTRSRC